MTSERMRRKITHEAAKSLHQRQQDDFKQARIAAARKLVHRRLHNDELPTHREIHGEVQRLSAVYPADSAKLDRFQFYRSLLIPLEKITQPRDIHPEGDVLYHSLQVYTLARQHVSWDEEFLLAALLHDVGKGVDPLNHVAAGLDLLEGHITDRTAWFIEHHSEVRRLKLGTLGARARRRMVQSEDYEDLLLLADCDEKGRVPGATVPELDEALTQIRELAQECG